jgi:rRNA maturation endonuclease Nob1
MYAEISSAVNSAKTALELVNAAKGLANFNELVTAVAEVNTKLLAAQNVAFASQESALKLSEQVNSLKEELLNLKALQAQSEDYELADLGAGVFGFLYKPKVQTTKPRHLACVKSFSEHGLGILQDERTKYRCTICGHTIVPFKNGQKTSIAEAYEMSISCLTRNKA